MPEVLSNPTFIEQLAQKLRAIGSLKAVGDTWISFDSSVPPGGVPFCGQEVTRALYADLWAWAQAQGKVKTELEWQEYAMANGGNCPYYSSGNGSTTFRMPCVLGYMKGSSVTTEGGTYKPQKLPNIKSVAGTFIDGSKNEAQPPFYHIGEGSIANNQNAEADDKMGFDLSLYNPDLYEDGADVQPETYQVLVGVYAVGVIQNINNTDVSQLQTGLATLEANVVKSINNKTPTSGNIELSIWSKPNAEYVENPTFPYTAPKSGVFYATRWNGSSSREIFINNNLACTIDDYGSISVPFKAGDIINVTRGDLTYSKLFFNEVN